MPDESHFAMSCAEMANGSRCHLGCGLR